jgi:hypothetical protein
MGYSEHRDKKDAKMSLRAVLTVGWKDDPRDEFSAVRLNNRARESEKGYQETLTEILKNARQPITIYGLEQLFRRRAEGFTEIKEFVGALTTIATSEEGIGTVRCHIDAFAYAFLKGAKNFDFLLPEEKDKSGPFRLILPKWEEKITALEEFERTGESPPPEIELFKEQYLDLRKIITRKSARDERRSLATLLVSGPSTLKEIKDDLGLNYSLSQRTIGTFTEIGVVIQRQDDERYVISQEPLLIVVFCLREVMGLDYLSVLD